MVAKDHDKIGSCTILKWLRRLIEDEAIAAHRGRFVTPNLAKAHAVVANAFPEKSVMRRIDDDASEVRNGQAHKAILANAHGVFARRVCSKSEQGAIEAADIDSSRVASCTASTAKDQAVLAIPNELKAESGLRADEAIAVKRGMSR